MNEEKVSQRQGTIEFTTRLDEKLDEIVRLAIVAIFRQTPRGTSRSNTPPSTETRIKHSVSMISARLFDPRRLKRDEDRGTESFDASS